MVLSRNVQELKQDLRHIEAEQGKGENHQELDCKEQDHQEWEESEQEHWKSLGGRSPAAMPPVVAPCSNSCSVPKCNNDLYLSVVVFQINLLLMLLLL